MADDPPPSTRISEEGLLTIERDALVAFAHSHEEIPSQDPGDATATMRIHGQAVVTALRMRALAVEIRRYRAILLGLDAPGLMHFGGPCPLHAGFDCQDGCPWATVEAEVRAIREERAKTPTL